MKIHELEQEAVIEIIEYFNDWNDGKKDDKEVVDIIKKWLNKAHNLKV